MYMLIFYHKFNFSSCRKVTALILIPTPDLGYQNLVSVEDYLGLTNFSYTYKNTYNRGNESLSKYTIHHPMFSCKVTCKLGCPKLTFQSIRDKFLVLRDKIL